MSKRILFVDDETKVLEGLRRMLRPMRRVWEMEFAPGGNEALAMVRDKPFDVVVSDIRMPGMDGATLLQHVREEAPGAVRVALSGHVEREQVVRLVGTVHQYLSKPCGRDKVMAVLARACQMSDLLANDTLREMVSKIESLPSLPELHMALLRELRAPEPSMPRIEEIVSRDMGMSSKVLQLVNSSFFGLRRTVSSPAQAVTLLGLDTIRALANTMHLFSQFGGGKHTGFSPEALWTHCMAVGTIAKRLAAEEGLGDQDVDDAFVGGLLHDIGILVLASNLDEEFERILQICNGGEVEICRAEREVLGATHCEMGAYLMALWGLPDSVVEAIMFHHNPSASHGAGFSPLSAVHLANYLSHHLSPSEDSPVDIQPDIAYLEAIGKRAKLSKWIGLIEASLDKEAAHGGARSVR